MGHYRKLKTATVSSSEGAKEGLKQFLAAVAKEPSMLNEQLNVDFLTREIRIRLCNFVLQSEENIDVKKPLLPWKWTRWLLLRYAIGGVKP